MISGNPETFFFYLAISTAVVFLVLVLIILVKVTMTRRRGRSGVQLSSSGASGSGSGGGGAGGSNKAGKHSSSATGPILSSGLSDIDELSMDMESNDIAFTELPSILKRSSPFDREHADARRDIRPLSTTTGSGPGGSGVATTTLSRSNEVVRFSNTLGRRDRDTNNPRSLRGQKSSEDNERFLYG